MKMTHIVMDESCEHEYPDDWQFGGANNSDPRSDPRWRPASYTYYDADTTELVVTQVPLCDDEALDYFTDVTKIRGANPRWVGVKREGQKFTMLPWLYYADRDEVVPRG